MQQLPAEHLASDLDGMRITGSYILLGVDECIVESGSDGGRSFLADLYEDVLDRRFEEHQAGNVVLLLGTFA